LDRRASIGPGLQSDRSLPFPSDGCCQLTAVVRASPEPMIVFAFCGKLRRSHGEEKIARTKAKFATPPLSDRLRRPRTQHEHDALGKMGTSCFRSRARSRSGSMAVRRSGSGRFTPDGLGHPSAPPPSRSETRQSRIADADSTQRRGVHPLPAKSPAPGPRPIAMSLHLPPAAVLPGLEIGGPARTKYQCNCQVPPLGSGGA
jgi:hypothetical protein